MLKQDDTLLGELSSADIATKKNLDDLVKVGEELLKKPVSRVNLDKGMVEPAGRETNEEALRRSVTDYPQERERVDLLRILP